MATAETTPDATPEDSKTHTEQLEESSPTNDDTKISSEATDGKSSTYGGTLTASKHHSILEKQIAFLSGATLEGYPILSFTSDGLKVLELDGVWEELDITLKYFSSLMDSDAREKGVVIVIDCRKGSQANVIKTLVEMIASPDFPLHCHSLFLLKSVSYFQITSFFSKNKPKLTTTEIKEKLKVTSVKDKDELFQYVPSESLTQEFSGTFPYDHQRWIKNNILFEKVKILRGKILEKFPDIRDGLNDFEIPQTVKDAERLMTEHLKLKEFFVNLFAEIDVCIDQLTTYLLGQSQDTTHSTAAAVAMLSSTAVLAYINQINEEVHEEQAEFEKFWSCHKSRLDHMMRTCHCKRTVEKVRHLIQGHIEDLTHTELVIGESLEASLELGEKHEVFVAACKEKMDGHMKDIQEEQVQLSKLPTGDEVKNQILLQDLNDVKQSVQLLTESYQELMKLCQQKRDLFIVAVKFHMVARQCEQWCSTVKEFTEVQALEDVSADKAGQLVEETDNVMKQLTQRQLNSLKDFASCLPEKQVKKLTTKTINKCNTSREKLEKYKNKLLQLVALSYTPPTPPQLPPLESSGQSLVDSCNSPEKSLKSSEPDSGGGDPLAWSPDYADDESDPSTLRKREFIYKEIIQTEKDYIEDLKVILDSYYNEMTPEDRVPLRLRGKRYVIFGNLEDIYRFHNETFLKQLELYDNNPERVGSCFIKHSSEFQLYSSYCQNRPNSEALLTESPECQSFFKEIQIRLAHQLPLNSYLIKPIQRITKYQLLIKDMIKHSTNAQQALRDLQMSLGIMLQVLKNLNDSLHVVGLKGFPGALAEQGKLLVHDPFQVWELTSHSRSLLSRSHERHVFLFEKVLIFSKKKDEAAQQKHKEKSDSYVYKNHLQLADVQLKEQSDENPVCFSLSIHGQTRLYKLQATSRDVCEMWKKELQRLLRDQFDLLKDVVLKSGTLDRATAAKFAKMRGSSQGKSKLFQEAIPPESRYHETKKSFSDRFKIRPKKKPGQASATDIPGGGRGSNNASPMSVSLSAKESYRDDYALSASTPGRLRNRAYSQDDLLDEEKQQEWSDEEEDGTGSVMSGVADHYEMLAPGMSRYYTAVAAYTPSEDDQGIPLQLEQEVELIGISNSGWWWVRATNHYTNEVLEGWVPASHLQLSKDY